MSSYEPVSIGQAQRAIEGVIIEVQPIVITTSSGVGGAAGGAIAGGLVGENSDNVGLVVAGIIGGVIIGELLERELSKANGAKYLLKTENGGLIQVAKLDSDRGRLAEGQKVALIYGYPSDLVPIE